MALAIIAVVLSALGVASGIYGAINARRAIKWQQDRDRVRVRVEFDHQADVRDPEGVSDCDAADSLPPSACSYQLFIIVVNESETASIFLRDVAIYRFDPSTESRGDGFSTLNVGAEDIRLRPRERIVKSVAVDTDVHFDARPGFVGVAELASGEQFESPHEPAWSFFADDPAWRQGEATKPPI